MATIQLPPDFKEFLKLLNSNKVEYLVVGGYAVNYYGYPRATADLDIWIAIDPANAGRLANVLQQFGFAQVQATTFLEPRKVIRMGVPPVRLKFSRRSPEWNSRNVTAGESKPNGMALRCPLSTCRI